MFSDEISGYVRSYQASRGRRCEDHDAIFLPLELLVDRASGTPNLSVSFSASSSSDVYITQRATLVRAVRVTTRWLIVPWTVAKVYTQRDFVDQFSELLEEAVVEGESFWVFRKENASQLKALIASLPLDETFRETFAHDYLPEPEERSA